MILALHTSSPTTSAWFFDASAKSEIPEPIAKLVWESGRNLSSELLSQLTNFLKENNAQLRDLSGVVIFSGPGSFTSLRIGHAMANALADSLGIPITGAAGDDWINHGIKQLGSTRINTPAMPVYGAEAHITKQKY